MIERAERNRNGCTMSALLRSANANVEQRMREIPNELRTLEASILSPAEKSVRRAKLMIERAELPSKKNGIRQAVESIE